MSRKWNWERTDPNRSGSSGDIAKLFRHEEPKTPGVMALNAPSSAATLMAREVLQNSWDSARELQKHDPTAPQFLLEFRFEELSGAEKRRLVEAFGLNGLSERLNSVEKGRKHLGLQPTDCLDELSAPDKPLRVLRIVEHATTGMYGSWSAAKSRMYWALVSVGYTMKGSGAGGSYGYGKAGLISGSRIRSIGAYTCFREQDNEPGITRRLLGMTYWGQHDTDESNYTGFARLGYNPNPAIDSVIPFENLAADEVARSLGMSLRDPGTISDLGTSFLVIDPTVEPDELLRALERNWWPAIIESDFALSVVDYKGTAMVPRPKRDPVLRTFISAWEIANERSQPNREKQLFSSLALSSPASEDLQKGRPLGNLALTSDLEDWSYADQREADDGDIINHRSLIALVRGPRMIVEYYEAGQAPPYVRGVFVANSDEPEGGRSIDDYLRQTEPKAHDSWRSDDADGELDPDAAFVAGSITRTIRNRVNTFRRNLKPAVPKAEDVLLPAFNDLMKRVLRGSGKGVPIPPTELQPLQVTPSVGLEEAGDGLIRVRGHVTFDLTEHAEEDAAEVRLHVGYRFVEDDRVGDPATVEFNIEGAPGFVASSPGTFTGKVERGSPIRIDFVSEAYQADWTGRLNADGYVIEQPEDSGSR